ncbi:MAG: Rne/Rng family ribonuclease [Actinobacteria bacterium]|nr:Rne/Rng family ribonuclease [Actinomycetota bacterium]
MTDPTEVAAQEAPATQPPVPSPVPSTGGEDPPAPGTTTSSARRRRRRGGRGRSGSRPATPGAGGEAGDAETDAESGAGGDDEQAVTAEARPRRAASGTASPRQRAPRAPKPSATEDASGAAAGESDPGDAEPADSEVTTGARKRRRRGHRGGRGRKRPSSSTGAQAPEVEEGQEPDEADSQREDALPGEGAAEKPAARRLRGAAKPGAAKPGAAKPGLEGRDLVQHYVTRVGAQSMVGNVYLGRVQNVLPGMEAAFIDIGRGRNGVLYAGEVNYSPEDLDRGSHVPRIEQVLKSGQAVMVQVTKDPMGGKGARLTAQISMPGRYLVMVPNTEVSGISRRLPDNERRRLKTIMKNIRPAQHGIIVRTAAEGASEEALATDLDRLVHEWDEIQKLAKKAKAPAVLYEEPELTVRVVRDLFNDEEFRGLVTDSPRVHEKVMEYVNAVAPDLAPKITLHAGKLPAFEEHHIEEQIHKALDRKVWLPSGGYLVIERTEAMTIVDVNTGKSVGKTNLEETVVNTNLEAAGEVARQLRLRDIGGIIVIDFIDMLLEQNKRKVEDTMKEALALDKTRSQVFEIGPLGLMQVTRKRVSGGLVESFSETCPTCEGRGIIINYGS